MEIKSLRRQYIPVTVKGRESLDLLVPTISLKKIEKLTVADYLSPDLGDTAMFQESIVKLFREGFDLDIKTCTEGEWAERITIKGGTLKQWQALTKVTKAKERAKEMGSTKAVVIFMALTVVLLIGIALLPKSSQVFVPNASASVSVTK